MSELPLMWNVWCILTPPPPPKGRTSIRPSTEQFCNALEMVLIVNSLTNGLYYLASASQQCTVPSGPECQCILGQAQHPGSYLSALLPDFSPHDFHSHSPGWCSCWRWKISTCRSLQMGKDSKTLQRHNWIWHGSCGPFRNTPITHALK